MLKATISDPAPRELLEDPRPRGGGEAVPLSTRRGQPAKGAAQLIPVVRLHDEPGDAVVDDLSKVELSAGTDGIRVRSRD